MSRWSPALLLLACSAGCAGEPPPEFATLTVRATGELPEVEGELRAVVMWGDSRPGGHGVTTTDDVSVELDGRFALRLRVHPVEAAEAGGNDVDGPIARGNIVAYLDRDGDGSFSWTRTSDAGFGDWIVGWVPGLRIQYAPAPTPVSTVEEGVSLEQSYLDGAGPARYETIPLDSELGLRLFDAADSACLGMSPPPQTIPPRIYDAILDVQPRPGRFWPYPVGVPDCPGNQLPDDWWEIACGSGPGRYVVTTVTWPDSDTIGELCGWSAWYCRLTLEDPEPPAELPSCG